MDEPPGRPNSLHYPEHLFRRAGSTHSTDDCKIPSLDRMEKQHSNIEVALKAILSPSAAKYIFSALPLRILYLLASSKPVKTKICQYYKYPGILHMNIADIDIFNIRSNHHVLTLEQLHTLMHKDVVGFDQWSQLVQSIAVSCIVRRRNIQDVYKHRHCSIC